MLRDWQVPDAVAPAEEGTADGHRTATWDPHHLEALARHVALGAEALAALPRHRLARAWKDTVAALRDPRSEERRRLDPALATHARLSPGGLDAALEAVLGGVAGEAADRVFERVSQGAGLDTGGASPERSPVLVVLAGNLPALAVQPLLPILALRRPAILKSSSAEPLFTPTFVAALTAREPVLGDAVAALTWPGGRRDLEAPLLGQAGTVLAYGDAEALTDLARRARHLVAYGPKTSLAVVGPAAEPREIAVGLARDVALFDQRGCLSLAAVYTVGDAEAVAAALADELAAAARRWPPGPLTTAEAAAVRQVREEAAMRGALVFPAPPATAPGAQRARPNGVPRTGDDTPGRLHPAHSLATGTVVLAPEGPFRPTPGARTVRVHPLSHPSRLTAHLTGWKGRLQGAAVTGFDAETHRRLTAALTALGVSRIAPPGHLQTPDTRWHNGGVDPLSVLA